MLLNGEVYQAHTSHIAAEYVFLNSDPAIGKFHKTCDEWYNPEFMQLRFE